MGLSYAWHLYWRNVKGYFTIGMANNTDTDSPNVIIPLTIITILSVGSAGFIIPLFKTISDLISRRPLSQSENLEYSISAESNSEAFDSSIDDILDLSSKAQSHSSRKLREQIQYARDEASRSDKAIINNASEQYKTVQLDKERAKIGFSDSIVLPQSLYILNENDKKEITASCKLNFDESAKQRRESQAKAINTYLQQDHNTGKRMQHIIMERAEEKGLSSEGKFIHRVEKEIARLTNNSKSLFSFGNQAKALKVATALAKYKVSNTEANKTSVLTELNTHRMGLFASSENTRALQNIGSPVLKQDAPTSI